MEWAEKACGNNQLRAPQKAICVIDKVKARLVCLVEKWKIAESTLDRVLFSEYFSKLNSVAEFCHEFDYLCDISVSLKQMREEKGSVGAWEAGI